MSNTATARNKSYTWADYRTWPDDERWELIKGEAFAMSPSPTAQHQIVQTKLGRKLDEFFDGKPCRAIVSPMDVKLSATDVVQPDVVVVCRPEQIQVTHIEGAPALVIEILSDSTELHDRGIKMRLYAAHGVKEVWLVTPDPSMIEVYRLDGESYRLAGTYTRAETLRSPGFPKLRLRLKEIFNFPPKMTWKPAVVRERPPPAYGTKKAGLRKTKARRNSR